MPFPPGWALRERRVTKARSRAPRGKPPSLPSKLPQLRPRSRQLLDSLSLSTQLGGAGFAGCLRAYKRRRKGEKRREGGEGREPDYGPKYAYSSGALPVLNVFLAARPQGTERPSLGRRENSLYANKGLGRRGLRFLGIQGGLSLYLHNFTRLHHREFYDLKTRLPLISQEPDKR